MARARTAIPQRLADRGLAGDDQVFRWWADHAGDYSVLRPLALRPCEQSRRVRGVLPARLQPSGKPVLELRVTEKVKGSPHRMYEAVEQGPHLLHRIFIFSDP